MQEIADGGDEIRDVLPAEGVAERQHRDGVTHLTEARGRGAADLPRRAVGAGQDRKAPLDRFQPAIKRVILRVGNLRRILDVIFGAVIGDCRDEVVMRFLRGERIEFFHRRFDVTQNGLAHAASLAFSKSPRRRVPRR